MEEKRFLPIFNGLYTCHEFISHAKHKKREETVALKCRCVYLFSCFLTIVFCFLYVPVNGQQKQKKIEKKSEKSFYFCFVICMCVNKRNWCCCCMCVSESFFISFCVLASIDFHTATKCVENGIFRGSALFSIWNSPQYISLNHQLCVCMRFCTHRKRDCLCSVSTFSVNIFDYHRQNPFLFDA